jgi:hypothetical protein
MTDDAPAPLAVQEGLRHVRPDDESREMSGVMPLPSSPRPQGPCPDTSA